MLILILIISVLLFMLIEDILDYFKSKNKMKNDKDIKIAKIKFGKNKDGDK